MEYMTPDDYAEQYGLARELNLGAIAVLTAFGADPMVSDAETLRATLADVLSTWGGDTVALAFAVLSHKLLEYLAERGLPRDEALQRLASEVVRREP